MYSSGLHGGFAGTRLLSGDARRPAGVCEQRGKQLRVVAGIGEDFQKLFDSMAFEKWAPKSSRTWRLRQVPGDAENNSAQAGADKVFVDSLNERIAALSSIDSVIDSIDDVRNDVAGLGGPVASGSTSDGALADSLNMRITDMAAGAGSSRIDSQTLTGNRLRELVLGKYGKTYDLSIARRDIAGRTLVALNVMWTHLEQQSFPMTEAQFMEKMDGIAFYVSAWGQADKVVDFLMQPPKSQRGLPGKPVVGCAVSLQLDLEPAVIDEWFN